MSDPDLQEDRLIRLRTALALLRVPSLSVGCALVLWTVFSGLRWLVSLAIFVDDVSFGALIALCFSALYLGIDLALTVLLLVSAILGFLSRADPASLVRSVRILGWFWWLAALRVVGALMPVQLLALLF